MLEDDQKINENQEEAEICEVQPEDPDKGSTDQTDGSGDESEYEEICYMCRRPGSIAGKMVRLPNNICVCQDCMQKTFDNMSNLGNIPGLENFDLGELFSGGRFPQISFLNMSDLQNMAQNQPKLKKRKKKEKEEKAKEPAVDITKIPAPHKIEGRLSEYVIGQDYAKKVMSVAVYNHYKRVASSTMEDDGVEIEKSNMLMLGPTGCGKTYIVRTLARLLNVPLAIADATSLTEAGYIGDDIESVLSKLLAAADNDVERAEHGIVFIDEIDKLARKTNATQRDVSGESVQQGMLKLLEGASIEVPVGATSKNAMVPMTTIDTSNILFICGGAFPGLEDIIKERLNKHSSVGFFADLKDKYDEDENLLRYVTTEDLRRFGMIPEFIGRFPIITHTDALTEEDLMRILTEPKNALIKQYQELLRYDKTLIRFSKEALREIAHRALSMKIGARGLRNIMEQVMLNIMYDAPDNRSKRNPVVVQVTPDMLGNLREVA